MTGLNLVAIEEVTRQRQAELKAALALTSGFHFFVCPFKPGEWYWIPVPTCPDRWSGPFEGKEQARAAGERAGGVFERYEEE